MKYRKLKKTERLKSRIDEFRRKGSNGHWELFICGKEEKYYPLGSFDYRRPIKTSVSKKYK